MKLSFNDVSIKPEVSDIDSRSNVSVFKKVFFKNYIDEESPVIISNMDTCGTFEMAEALYKHRMIVALHKFYSAEKLIAWFNKNESDYSLYSMGMKQDDLDKLKYVLDHIYNITKYTKLLGIRLDVANGYMSKFHDFIKKVRDTYPFLRILAGNVCTPEGCEAICKAGADAVVCGIGNGSLCLTSNKAGIGIPQMSVCIECGQACHELGKQMVSDGGIRSPADICKALTRADYVMCGGLFMGYDECEGEWDYEIESRWITHKNDGFLDAKEIPVLTNKRKALRCYGMSSKAANDKYNGGLKEYRTAEGKEEWIPYKGKVEELVRDINGSLTSACAYTNCYSVDQLLGKELIILK